jgi:exopolysaccharide production protein ExoZ
MNDRRKLHSVHFLRFAAAFAVVLHHIVSAFDFPVSVGAAGVDIFFVISGLVIGISMPVEPSPAIFAIKRLIRVIPLYWLASILFWFVSHYTWGYAPSTELLLRSIVLFPGAKTEWQPLYAPAWTLGYEMFFYLLATLCMVLFKDRARLVCFVFMLVLAIIPIPIPFAAKGVHYLTNLCLEFCAGLAISELVLRRVAIDRKTGAIFVVAAIVAFAINYAANGVPRPIAWGIPAALLVLGALAFDDVKWFRSKAVKLGGAASYVLYLTHLSTIQFSNYVANRAGFHIQEHMYISLLIEAPAALAVAAIAHLYIEAPLLSFLKKNLLPGRSDDKKNKQPSENSAAV